MVFTVYFTGLTGFLERLMLYLGGLTGNLEGLNGYFDGLTWIYYWIGWKNQLDILMG